MTTPVPTALVTKSVHLYLRSGTSDKEYHLYLCFHPPTSSYSVHAEYGRRGSPNSVHDKTSKGRESLGPAQRLFDKFETEKRGDGYSNMGMVRPPRKTPGVSAALPVVAAPAVAAPTDPGLDALERFLGAYMDSSSEIQIAAVEAVNRIISRRSLKWSFPLDENAAEVRVIRVLLGDLACSLQDYVDDALPLLENAFKAPSSSTLQMRLASLVGKLSTAAQAAVETARSTVASSETTGQFLGKVLGSLRNMKLT